MLATNRKSVRAALTLIIGFGAATIAAAQTTYYVNGSCGDDSWTGLSPVCEAPDGPKRTIQAGIDAADHFDEVVVADGLYRGAGNKNLEFFTKEMSIRSTGGPEKCIIDCENDGFGFTFCTLPDDRPVTIAGFTIRNGRHQNASGICIYAADVKIDNCIIEHCIATGWRGGGISIGQASNVWITRTIIRFNSAEASEWSRGGRGGGVYIEYDSYVKMDGCFVEDNTAYGDGGLGDVTRGGGIYVERTSGLHLRRSEVSRNRAVALNRAVTAQGGGLYHDGYNPRRGRSEIRDTRFTDNEAVNTQDPGPAEGGGLFLGTLPIVSNCDITGNRAGFGGGAAISGGAEGYETITDSRITGNTALLDGGGLLLRGGSKWFTQLTLTDNHAGRDGGGAAPALGGGQASWTSCEIARNVAGRDGGGLSAPVRNMGRCRVIQNHAGRNGGGLHMDLNAGIDARIDSTLIAANRADEAGGGCFSLDPRGLSILNSTIASNDSEAGGGGLHVAVGVPGEVATIGSSVFYDNAPFTIVDNSGLVRIERSNIEGGWPGAGNIDADPRFVDPANGDYRLLPGSPCIDAGDNRAVVGGTDLARNPRRVDDPGMPNAGIGLGAIVDMGAYEFQGVSSGFITVHPRPGLAGRSNQLQAAGAAPGERVYFVYGFSSGATGVPGCPGLTIGIANAQIAAQATADSDGNASAIIPVPNAAAGRTILLQALDRSACEVSNLVRYRFP